MSRRSRQTGGAVTVAGAAQQAGVEVYKVKELARNRVIFAQKDADGVLRVSPAVIADLPILCARHFTERGEFVENPAVIADYHETEIDNVRNITYKEID